MKKEKQIDSRSPQPKNDNVRKSMASNKSKGTSPELLLCRLLRERGFSGYRLNWPNAPGRPDICYPGRNVAVFVHGCFWHRCPECNLPLPSHNRDFWKEKFEKNAKRDAEKKERLIRDGWRVIIVWECRLKKDPDSQAAVVISSLTHK